ncbi:MAG: 50S ribosomal protein L1 [Phycisphaerae bacterium]|nr:50S ribosomal protein L1 [Phycisphaerae bacterium]MBM90974.1 50S ribosomal protein L1 [Phycisphaerae bacterium]HCT45895.1 50S ribosomal protein L1 [Phycisphaerales bacterium]|tara:strand:+ start:885 stop:1574 length:690 start_codon:yes stop_codon:yes gene_type:complete
MAKSKRAQENIKLTPREALEANEAFVALKKFVPTKFDQAVEVCMHLGVDVKHADQMVRGSVSLPKGIGKAKRVIAFCDAALVDDCKAAGAVEAGGTDLMQKVDGGWFDFDVAIASPDMMRVISKLGRVLGPKGLMPSPKNGTVTPKVAEAVGEFAAGKVEYRADKGGNVHAVIGRMSFSADDLLENYNHFYETIEKARPSAVKGEYVKRITISGTMTPGVQIKTAVAAE